ncbi:unnamed protein product [Calypogeia fissa]
MEDPAAAAISILSGVVVCGVFALMALHYSSTWLSFSKSGARLPKGTFSWPIIGETVALTRDPLGFAISHQKRYGSILKSFLFADGPRHVAVTRVFKKLTIPESVPIMVQALESIILENLASWKEQGTVLGREATDKLVADLSSYIALGVKSIRSTPERRLAVKNLLTMVEGIGGIPINLPGTTHNKGRKARAAVKLYLKSVVEQRKKEVDNEPDILRSLLEARERARGDELNYYDEDNITDDIVGSWFGAFKTTATTLTWTLKFLVDYPDIFRRIQAEQQEILKGKDLSVEGPRLTWEDTKRMVYTSKFYQEVQRSLSISYVIPRMAAEDVVYDGFLIPKGWAVLPLLNYVHHDPAKYEDPESMNPDRFNVPPKSNTYIPFGLGAHRCPGEEITKLIFFIHVHHLTTTYK